MQAGVRVGFPGVHVHGNEYTVPRAIRQNLVCSRNVGTDICQFLKSLVRMIGAVARESSTISIIVFFNGIQGKTKKEEKENSFI